jgi:hypothetical protein
MTKPFSILFVRFLFTGVVPAIAIYFNNILGRSVFTVIAAIVRVVAHRAIACRMRAFVIVCHIKNLPCSFVDFVKIDNK